MAYDSLRKTLTVLTKNCPSRLVIRHTPTGDYNRGKVTVNKSSYAHYVGILITRYSVFAFSIYYGNLETSETLNVTITPLGAYQSETMTVSSSGNVALFKSNKSYNEFNFIGFTTFNRDNISISQDKV